MKMKLITALLAFFATFGLSIGITGLMFGSQTNFGFGRHYDAQTQRKVLTLLDQDIANGDERFDKFPRIKINELLSSNSLLAGYADAVSEYSNKSANINDADLPQDFQIAWRAHMQAWRTHADFLNQIKNPAVKQSFDQRELAYSLYDQSQEIKDTWFEALDVAEDYGAFPQNAY